MADDCDNSCDLPHRTHSVRGTSPEHNNSQGGVESSRQDYRKRFPPGLILAWRKYYMMLRSGRIGRINSTDKQRMEVSKP